MQAMAIKHGMRRCNLKRYAKRVLLRPILKYFGPKKRSVRPLHTDLRLLWRSLANRTLTHSLMHATIARTHATHAAGEEHKGIPKHQGTLLDRRSQFTANNTTRNFKYFGILIPQNSQPKQTGQVHVQSTLVRKLTTRRLLAPDVLSSCLRRLRYSFDALAARFPR